MIYGHLSLFRLVALAVLLCTRAVTGSLAPSDVWAAETEPSGTVASFLSQSDLSSLSLAAKSLGHMLSLAESLKPTGVFRPTGTFPFCKTLNLSGVVVPDLLEVLTAHRFPRLVSLDLGSYTAVELPEQPLQPLPVLAGVRTLRVSQSFLRFPLLPEIFPNLESLTVEFSYPRRVVDWSFIAGFRTLKEFEALICSVGAPEAAALPKSLTVLRVASVEAPIRLPHLQELTLNGHWMLPDLNTLEVSSRSLKKVAISSAPNLLDVQSLRLMADSLEELRLYRFTLTDGMLEQLEVIRLLENLRSICLEPESDFSSIPFDASKVFGSRLRALEDLYLRRIPAVNNLQSFLYKVPMLSSLELVGSQLRDHQSLDVSHLGNLENLSLYATELTHLRLWNDADNTGATRLVYLNAGSTRAFHGLERLRLLRHAEFEGTAVLPEKIAQLINLRRLTWPGIPYVEPLAALVHLKELNIGYGKTPDLSALAGMEKLAVCTNELGWGTVAQVLAFFAAKSSR